MTQDTTLSPAYRALVDYPSTAGWAWPGDSLPVRMEPIPEPAPKRPPYLLTQMHMATDPQAIFPPEEGYVLYHVQVVGEVVWLVWSHAYNL